MVRQQTQNWRSTRQTRVRALCALSAITLMVGGVTARHGATFRKTPRSAGSITSLTPIRYVAKQTNLAELPTFSVLVKIDAQGASATDSTPLASVLHDMASTSDSLPDAPANASVPPLPTWFTWAHLDAKPAHVQISAPAAAGTNPLAAYATRGEWGMSLCLVNKSNARLLTTAQLCLPRGVYTLERLTIVQRAEEGKREKGDEESKDTSSTIHNPQSTMDLSLNPQPSTLNHLEGCDFGGLGTARKVFCLEPGQMCVYRCMDSAREARTAWYDVFTQLREMGVHQPAQAKRLSVMLREADSYVSGVSGGGNRRGRDARLECIHHLLLVTAQAHSLHHNYQMRHTVEENMGRRVMTGMDHLTTALSETSAVLLGLVPQVSVTPNASSGAQARTAALIREQMPTSGANKETPSAKKETFVSNKKENTVGASNSQTRAEHTVVVSLENTGGRSVSNVKLGLNMAGMPSGSICEPADPAYFDALRPGQSVRATFHVRSVSGADLPTALLTGDVSYFAGTAPAHLRPRAW